MPPTGFKSGRPVYNLVDRLTNGSTVNNRAVTCIHQKNMFCLRLHYFQSLKWHLSAYYQLAARKARGRLVLRLLCVFHVCWYIYIYIYIHASTLITCTIITSCSLHCCHATLLSQLQQFRRLLCVATTSSLAQLQVRDGYREAEST